MIISYQFLLWLCVILGCIVSFDIMHTGFNLQKDGELVDPDTGEILSLAHHGVWIANLGKIVGLSMVVLVALAGCTNPRDRALIAAGQAAASLPTMADSELTCADEPSAPAPKGGAAKIRESQLTDYILDVREAGADCRDKLGVVRRVWRKVEDVKSRAVPPANLGETK